MTQPMERQQIAATFDGQPIFVPRQVAPGEDQPIGELADGQPVWPLPAAVQSQAGPVPFGLTSSGQPVWAQTSKPTRPFYKKKRVLIPAACVVLLGFAGAGGEGGSATDTVSASSTATADDKAVAEKAAADEKAAAEKAAADKAAEKAAAEKAAEAAKGTLSQQNAYDSAVSYLNMTAFSRAGIIKQLTSEYGAGFPAGDAEFAVARLEREGAVDWNAEAAEAAKSYLELTPMSRQGLLEQLTSEYGAGFTPEQAEYGVSQTGL